MYKKQMLSDPQGRIQEKFQEFREIPGHLCNFGNSEILARKTCFFTEYALRSTLKFQGKSGTFRTFFFPEISQITKKSAKNAKKRKRAKKRSEKHSRNFGCFIENERQWRFVRALKKLSENDASLRASRYAASRNSRSIFRGLFRTQLRIGGKIS
jgi:hypothetical protein